MRLVFAAITNLALTVYKLKGETCPQEYLRITKDHTFCKPINASCKFRVKGIQSEQEKIDIVNIHNELRNKVAMGKENLAGRLPKASNMLAFSWDDELSRIAQKLAEQCVFDHDCNDCRATASRKFSVGQNIFISGYTCSESCQYRSGDWSKPIKVFYDEVENFDKDIIKSMVNIEHHPKRIGHFTQVIWAETYKVGCGYASFDGNDGFIMQFYVCNYGPAGNLPGATVYLKGKPCSNCPENSCCGSSCKEKEQKKFPGLCFLSSSQSRPSENLKKLNTTPKPLKNKAKFTYFCDFQENDENCKFDLIGDGEWEFVKTPEGSILKVVVQSGKIATVRFQKLIHIKEGNCMHIKLRKGGIGERKYNYVKVAYRKGNKVRYQEIPNKTMFNLYKKPITSDGEFQLEVVLTAVQDSPPQFLEIKNIGITEDPCKKQKQF